MPDTPLLRLRKRQLYDLAQAFGIELAKDLTKNEILPTMIAAENRGTFRTQPVDQAALVRAGWAHGEGPFPREQLEAMELPPEREHIIGRGKGELPDKKLTEWDILRNKVRDKMGDDFKIYGKSREELVAVLEGD